VFDDNCFIILVLNFNTSRCLQSSIYKICVYN